MNGRPPGISVAPVPPAAVNAPRPQGSSPWNPGPQTWPLQQGPPSAVQPPPPARPPLHYSSFPPEVPHFQHHGPPPPTASEALPSWHARSGSSELTGGHFRGEGLQQPPPGEGYQHQGGELQQPRAESFHHWEDAHDGNRDNRQRGESFGGYPSQGLSQGMGSQRGGPYGGCGPVEVGHGRGDTFRSSDSRDGESGPRDRRREGYGSQSDSLYSAGSYPGGSFGAGGLGMGGTGLGPRQNSGGASPSDGRHSCPGDAGELRGSYPDHHQSALATASPRFAAPEPPRGDPQPCQHTQKTGPTFAPRNGPVPDNLSRRSSQEMRAPESNFPQRNSQELRGPGPRHGKKPGFEQFTQGSSQEFRAPEAKLQTAEALGARKAQEKPQSVVYSDLSATARQWVPAGGAAKQELWPEVQQKPREEDTDLHRCDRLQQRRDIICLRVRETIGALLLVVTSDGRGPESDK